MNPFVIHCTTCQARLKVNDESAIGGIYACPKCGSMVQVLPPPAAQTAAPVAANSPTKSKPAKSKPTQPNPAKLQVAKPLAETAATKTPSAAPVAATSSTQPVAAKNSTPPPLPARKATADAASVAVAAAVLPVAGAASTSKIALATGAAIKYVRQEPWLFGGALAAGIGIGTVIWLAVASGGAAKAEPESSAAVQTSTANPSTALTSAENRAQANIRSQPHGTDKAPAVDAIAAKRLQPDPQGGAAVEKPADVAEPVVGAPQTARDDEAVAAADNAAIAGADEAAGTAETQAQAAPPAEEPSAPRGGAQTSRQLEIESRLAGPVQSVEFRKVQLAQFALFISDLIAAPVELDLPALKAAGKGPESLVSIKLQKTTAAAALTAALESHGLVFAVRGDRVLITTK